MKDVTMIRRTYEAIRTDLAHTLPRLVAAAVEGRTVEAAAAAAQYQTLEMLLRRIERMVEEYGSPEEKREIAEWRSGRNE